jgi:hypothetical protein
MQRFLLKRGLLITIAALGLLTLLRETGVWGINLFAQKAETLTSNSTNGFPKLNATQLEFLEDDGKPFLPRPTNIEETYHVVLRYRIVESLTWARWIPLVKSGKNRVQIVYCVWEGASAMGLGVIDSDARLSVYGLCSAKEYRKTITEPLLEKMRQTAKDRISLFQYQGPREPFKNLAP